MWRSGKIWILIQEVWGEAWDHAFLNKLPGDDVDAAGPQRQFD